MRHTRSQCTVRFNTRLARVCFDKLCCVSHACPLQDAAGEHGSQRANMNLIATHPAGDINRRCVVVRDKDFCRFLASHSCARRVGTS
jgi:hypothetical protein